MLYFSVIWVTNYQEDTQIQYFCSYVLIFHFSGFIQAWTVSISEEKMEEDTYYVLLVEKPKKLINALALSRGFLVKSRQNLLRVCRVSFR